MSLTLLLLANIEGTRVGIKLEISDGSLLSKKDGGLEGFDDGLDDILGK